MRGQQPRRGGAHRSATSGSNSPHPFAMSASSSTPSARGEPSLPRWSKRMLEKKWRHQHDMRKFILSALASNDISTIAVQLADGEGLEKVREILSTPFCTSAGASSRLFSFQRIAVPFCALLIRAVNSPRAVKGKQLLRECASVEAFFENVTACMEECKARSVADDRVDTECTAYDPQTMEDVAHPIMSCMLACLRAVTDEVHQARWPGLIARLDNVVPAKGNSRDCLRRMMQMVDAERERDEMRRRAQREFELAQSEALAMQIQLDCEEAIPIDMDPLPGTLRAEGPRHDNDYEDYRNIRVLPTSDEISCTVAPYIPKQFIKNQFSDRRGSTFQSDPTLRHLDIQFRLLREDMLAPIRRGVQALAEECQSLQDNPKKWSWRHDSVRIGSTRYVTFRQCVIQRLCPDFNASAASCEVDFDHPAPGDKEDFWRRGRGSRLLQTESLVAFVRNARDMDVWFAKVTSRAVTLVEGDAKRCRVRLQLVDNEQLADLVEYMSAARTQEALLLQVRGHFIVSHETVLRSLQSQGHGTTPLLLQQLTANVEDYARWLDVPSFVRGAQFDLRCLLKDGTRDSAAYHLLENVDIQSYDQLKRILTHPAVATNLRMDESQAAAFVAAMTRQLALIQGPPGTGKTFVGVEIARALVTNSGGTLSGAWRPQPGGGPAPPALHNGQRKPMLFPILCICYTNHALDQFLESLIEGNIVQEEEVIRVGGRSRSQRMEKCTLYARARNLRGGAERFEFQCLKKKANELEEKISVLCDSLQLPQDSRRFYQQLESFLRDEYDEDYAGIVGDDAEEGFQVVGGFAVQVEHWIKREDSAERQRQWKQWIVEWREDIREELTTLLQQYDRIILEIRECNLVAEEKAAKMAKVVGMTTTGCAKYDKLLRAIQPCVVICEEAGEVLECHLLASLTWRTASLILIGDHQQLRPKPSEYCLSCESGNGYDLDISLFERLVMSDMPKETLYTQRRMHPDISALLQSTLYPRLVNDGRVHQHPEVRGLVDRLLFFDHHHMESGDDRTGASTSKSNVFEAEMVVSMAMYFVRQGYEPHQIAVLTPYVGQLLQIKNFLAKQRITVFMDERTLEEVERTTGDALIDVVSEQEQAVVKSLRDCLRLSTVDNFQGEEADIVLISTVRCNAQHRLGFLKIDNRVNVMLSRARHGMIVFGSASTVRGSRQQDTMFAKVLRLLSERNRLLPYIPLKCQAHGSIMNVTCPADVPSDGGCTLPCLARMQCGHTCPRQCHPDNLQHLSTECREPCTRRHACGHDCPKLCWQPCGECTVRVTVPRPGCDHMITVSCATARNLAAASLGPCREVVELETPIVLPCGHPAQRIPCAELTSGSITCTSICAQLIAGCNHECDLSCSECRQRPDTERHRREQCQHACGRVLFCGHFCTQLPCHDAKDCPSCPLPCSIACEHNKCTLPCSEPCYPCREKCSWKHSCKEQFGDPLCQGHCATPCTGVPCDRRCSRQLPCGHRCPTVCGEPCPFLNACPECARNGDVDEEHANQLVDLIMYTTLREHEVDDDDPTTYLVRLGCGHSFTLGSLDEQGRLNIWFDRGKTVPLGQLSPDVLAEDLPRCSVESCRAMWSKVARYGRAIKFREIQLMQRKWCVSVGAGVERVREQFGVLMKALSSDEQKPTRSTLKTFNSLVNEVSRLKKRSPVRALAGDRPAQLEVQHRQGEAGCWHAFVMDHVIKMRFHIIHMGSLLTGDEIPPKPCKFRDKCTKANCALRHPDGREHALNDPAKKFNENCADYDARLRESFEACIEACEAAVLYSKRDDVIALYVRVLLVIFDDLGTFAQLDLGEQAPEYKASEFRRSVVDELTRRRDEYSLPRMLCDAIERAREALSAVRYTRVTDEELRAVFQAMGEDVGTGVGSFGGHWYVCANGHPYAIGECGGAVTEAACPECGEPIGGRRHRLRGDNAIATDFLHRVQGQAPPSGWREEGDRFANFRG